MIDIGFIGLGAMGSRITRTLLDAGYRPRVWNRSRMHVNMATISVSLARDLAARHRARGLAYVAASAALTEVAMRRMRARSPLWKQAS